MFRTSTCRKTKNRLSAKLPTRSAIGKKRSRARERHLTKKPISMGEEYDELPVYWLRSKRAHSESENSEEEELNLSLRELEALCQNASLELIIPKNKIPRVTISTSLAVFLSLLEDDVIQNFLWVDSCIKISDRYLLSMVYEYFRRSSLPLELYNRLNFFAALYLANDMEEDNEESKYLIFPWACGVSWSKKYPVLLKHRDMLWYNMGFRAIVSKRTCEEIISLAPEHRIWQRYRYPHHGGAHRTYTKIPISEYSRTSPPYCHECSLAKCQYVGVVPQFVVPPTCYYGDRFCWGPPPPSSVDLLDKIDYIEHIKDHSVISEHREE